MTPITVSSMPDLLTVLPYQLGFYPRRSLALVVLVNGRVELTVRMDLDPLEQVDGALVSVRRAISRLGASSAYLVAYEDSAGESTAVARRVAAALRRAGVRVAGSVVVRDGRWRERGRGGEWRSLPAVEEVPAARRFQRLGVLPAPDRDLLRLDIEPLPDGSAPLRCHLLSSARQRREDDVRADRHGRILGDLDRWREWYVGRVCADPAPLGDGTAVELLASLDDRLVRDIVIAWLTQGHLSPDDFGADLAAAIRERLPVVVISDDDDHPDAVCRAGLDLDRRIAAGLEVLCRTTPASQAAPVLTVLASLRWSKGDGARARVALDKVLAIDPTYSLALLLDQVIAHGIRPADCA